jgi:predicted N-acetyltransferase YhbS
MTSIETLSFRRIETQKELSQINSLISQAFEVPEGSSFFDDFPVWNQVSGDEIVHFSFFEADLPVAVLSVRLGVVNAEEGQALPVAIIGGVSTHLDWRKKGLAGKLIQEALEWAEQKQVALSVLWTGDFDYYRKYGFEPAGLQVRFSLKDLALNLPSKSKIQVHEGWIDSIFEERRLSPYGLKLNEQDRQWYKAHESVNWFWAENSDAPGKLKAYAGFGRGSDLSNIIHEWGGDPEALRVLLSEVRKNHPEAELITPVELFHLYFSKNIEEKNVKAEFLCLMAIHSPEMVFEAYGIEGVDVMDGKVGQTWRLLDFEGGSTLYLSASQIAMELFGPELENMILEEPLPLWFWGLDSA